MSVNWICVANGAARRRSCIGQIGLVTALLTVPFFNSGTLYAQEFDPSLAAAMYLVEQNEATRAKILSYDIEFETDAEVMVGKEFSRRVADGTLDADVPIDKAVEGGTMRYNHGVGRAVRDGEKYRGYTKRDASIPELGRESTIYYRELLNENYMALWPGSEKIPNNNYVINRIDLTSIAEMTSKQRGQMVIMNHYDVMTKGWGDGMSPVRDIVEGISARAGTLIRVRLDKDEEGWDVSIMEFFHSADQGGDTGIPWLALTFDTNRGNIITRVAYYFHPWNGFSAIRTVEPRLVDGYWIPYAYREKLYFSPTTSWGEPGALRQVSNRRITSARVNHEIDAAEFELIALGCPADKMKIMRHRVNGKNELASIRNGRIITNATETDDGRVEVLAGF